MNRAWMFLGVKVDVLTGPDAPVVVAEGVLPAGASPPLHVHEDLDDSFYLLDGQIVVRCGDDVFVATPGTWIQFPAGVPHTFRVMDRPARVLLVHANGSFMSLVTTLGVPALEGDVPTTVGGPSVEELSRAFAAHGIANVGPCMEEQEADEWRRLLAKASG